MDANQHAFFTLLNDIILLHFDCLTPWEKTFITDLHRKAKNQHAISPKQQQIATKIATKAVAKANRSKKSKTKSAS